MLFADDSFSGRLVSEDGSTEVKGVVKIPYMGDENDFDDFEVRLFLSFNPNDPKHTLILRFLSDNFSSFFFFFFNPVRSYC